MKNLRVVLLALVSAGFCMLQPSAWSQSVAVTWPLTVNQTANSSSNILITGSPEVVSGGTSPTLSVWDYWSGQAQRLYAGTNGWVAGPVSLTRYLQFDVHPTAGNQLTVSQVRFQYGGEHNVAQIVRADVRYSTNNWSSWTVLSTGLVYPANAMGAFSMPVSVPAIPAGGTFSLRILPYAVAPQNAGTPTWAAHNNVQIIGTNTPTGSAHVRLHITKSTGSNVVPGNYAFNVTCSGIGGPYTGTNPVIVALPGPAIDAQVPQGDTCTLAETPISGWTPPLWGGSNAPIVPNGWNAQIGPMNVNTTLIVTNQPPANVPHVRLHITKSTGSSVIPGNYPFNVTCTGPNGPYTGTNPVMVPLPGSGVDVQIPQGDTCTLTETPISGWGQPIWGGSTAVIVPNGWSAQIGPLPFNNTLIVTNQPPANVPHVRLHITKSTGSSVIPGNYPFNVTCTGPNGPYTGTNPVMVPLPGSGVDVQIPQGDTCTLNETPVSGWGQPIWGGSTAVIVPNGWSAQIGPLPFNNTLIVTNQPPTTAGFTIQKQFSGPAVNGTYTFHISCSGAYTGPSTIQITVPPNPSSTQIQVPVNATCTISENPIGGWNPPLWGGSSQPLNPNGWSVTMGPFHPTGGPGDRVQVTNQP